MRYKVRLDFDPEAEDPCEYGMWKVVSFCTRHVAFEHPDRYLGPRDQTGELTPVSIGMRRKLKAGTAFLLSYYEHGDSVWSLRGEGPQCRWDSVDVAGILLATDLSSLPRSYEDRERYAREFLETYTRWCNGEYYGYTIEEDDGTLVDSCWGFDCPKYMLECIRDRLGPSVEVKYCGPAAFLGEDLDIRLPVRH